MERTIEELMAFAAERLEPRRALVGDALVERLAEGLATVAVALGATAPPRAGQERLGFDRVRCVREAMLRESPTLGSLAEVSMEASLRVAGIAALGAAADDDAARPPDSPELAAWRARLRRELGQELRAEGFDEDEITWILVDSAFGWWGIAENLWRLYKALRAYDRARATVGPPPP